MEIILLIAGIFLFGLVNGIVSLVRLISHKPTNSQGFSRQQYLQEVIQDLELELKRYPNDAHLQNLRDRYKTELQNFKEASPEQISSQAPVVAASTTVANKQTESFWENWYKENSINFLLYVGAFFIVLSCIIFLSFTWDTLSGMTRFLSFSLFTVCFGIAGVYLYRLPKVSQAGVTFLGITALLIPLNGAAFQRFVLQTNDLNSSIWFITSFLSLIFYLLLFKIIPNRFYTVLLNLGSLSLVESFLSFYTPETENYIFGALVTSFALFGAYLMLKKYMAKDVQDTFDGSSQIILLASLIYGLITLGMKGDIFIWQASLALYLSGAYYLLRYIVEKNRSLIVSLIFFSTATFFEAQVLDFSSFATSLSMTTVAFITLFCSYLLREKNRESTWLLRSSLITGVFAHLYLVFPTIQKQATQQEFTLLTLSILVLTFCSYIMHQKKEMLYATFAYLMLFLWVFNDAYISLVLPYQESVRVSFLYFATSIVFAFLYNDRKDTKEPLLFSVLCSMGFSLGVGYLFNEPFYFSLVSFCNLLFSLFLLTKFKENEKIFIPAVTFLIFVYSLIRSNNIDIQYAFFAETIASGILYLCSFIPTEFVTNKTQKTTLRNIGLSCGVFFALIAGANPDQKSFISTASLLSLILAAVYCNHYYVTTKAQTFAYFASFLLLCVLLRIFYNAEIDNMQFYIQPIAYYALASGLYKFKKQEANADTIVALGLAISIVALFTQSFGREHIIYAVYLALEGLLCISLGIGLSEKTIKYGGLIAVILAVFAQTSDYIFNLPRWLLVGILGLLILSTGIYLLRTKTKT